MAKAISARPEKRSLSRARSAPGRKEREGGTKRGREKAPAHSLEEETRGAHPLGNLDLAD